MQYFLFIHYEPILLMKSETKKECIAKVRNLANTSNNLTLLKFVKTASDTSISRLIFYTDIAVYKKNIFFHTYKKKRDGIKSHLSFSLHESINSYEVPEIILKQYSVFKRKDKISKLIKNV